MVLAGCSFGGSGDGEDQGQAYAELKLMLGSRKYPQECSSLSIRPGMMTPGMNDMETGLMVAGDDSSCQVSCDRVAVTVSVLLIRLVVRRNGRCRLQYAGRNGTTFVCLP